MVKLAGKENLTRKLQGKVENELREGDVKIPSKFYRFTNAQDYGYDFILGLMYRYSNQD